MSSTNKTTNYNLSQFVGSDVPSYLGDYNSDMSKIDKAIGDVANSQGSVEQSVVGLTAEVQGLSTQVSGVSTSVQQLQTSVAQIDSGYKQADTALSQRITANANNIQTNTTAIDGINTAIGTEDISEIGDGTIKGAISNINSGLKRKRRNITSDLTNLTTAIAEQDLAKYGYAIGDYFIGASGYYYYLADMDTNYGGYNYNAVVNTHHCGIVVDTKLTCQWLASGSVTNYSSSTLHSFLTNTVLPNIKSDITTLFGDWESHLIKRTELDNSIASWGTEWTGLADCLICAMTEVQMYGSSVVSVDKFQTGTGCKPLELFRKYRFNEIYGNVSIWLKSLFSNSYACCATDGGAAGDSSFSSSGRASGLILFH